jgi:hypothetical protein
MNRWVLDERNALMSSIVIVELAGIFLRKSRRVAVGVKRRDQGGAIAGLSQATAADCSFIVPGLCSATAQSGEPKLDDCTAMQASKNSILSAC